MKIQHHIGTKIRVLILSFTLLISVFFILMLLSYAWVVEDNVFNRLVAEEAEYLKQNYDKNQTIRSPRLPFMKLYRSWEELPETIQLLRQQSPNRIEFPLASGGTLHLKMLNLGANQWILAADVTKYEVSKDYLPKIIKWILAAIVGIFTISFFISRYLTNHIVKPIQTIAHSIESHDGDEKLKIRGHLPSNEIGYLAASIESSFNRLQLSLERESQFTRDISHELRTPTSVLKMLSERMTHSGQLSTQSKERFRQSVEQLEQTIDVLLALAREESLSIESITLNEEIEYCIINHFKLAEDTQADIHLDVAPTLTVQANKNLLHILINNLLDNAINHGTQTRLTIITKGSTLLVSNPAKQVLNDKLLEANVKDRKSQGLGLGLFLVKRICEKMGWQVNTQFNADEFVVSIDF